ncbi:hypothetical protein P4O66_002908 [Electrophorus voltai]|uniref:C2H2-type domain-containing protein n=1 Tax=Electrophorus voltai TaxID=2609070 RepID=A0AAD8YUB0_9TELE|nr:hypothetical protein P4O66_002908 [Electrophorus voltai]
MMVSVAQTRGCLVAHGALQVTQGWASKEHGHQKPTHYTVRTKACLARYFLEQVFIKQHFSTHRVLSEAFGPRCWARPGSRFLHFSKAFVQHCRTEEIPMVRQRRSAERGSGNHMEPFTFGSGAGEKAIVCDQCGAQFQKEDDLEAHRQIHTGKKMAANATCTHPPPGHGSEPRCASPPTPRWRDLHSATGDICRGDGQSSRSLFSISAAKMRNKIIGDSLAGFGAKRTWAQLPPVRPPSGPLRPLCQSPDPKPAQPSPSPAFQPGFPANAAPPPYRCLSTLLPKNPRSDMAIFCLLCGKRFQTQTALQQHMEVHAGVRSYICSECNRTFPSHTALKRHLRSHTGDHPFECEFCGSCFRDESTLKGHKRIHTGEKPYECNGCGKKFSLKHQLETHYRVHTGEKPFECKLCHQRSRDYSAMIKHLRTHNGASPYQCTICLEYCPSLSAMQKHMKSHKPEDIPPDWRIEKTYLYLCYV